MGKASRLRQERKKERSEFFLAQQYREVATVVLPRFFAANCCLNGTRVFVEVMRRFGQEAKPIVVNMVVMNTVWKGLMEKSGGWPRNQEQSDAWTTVGGWALGVDGQETDEGWPHHLVATLGDVMVDSSAGQASRPKHGIILDNVLVVPFDGWPCAFSRDTTFVYYDPKPDVKFDDIPGWQLSPHNLQVADVVHAMMLERRK